MTQRRIDLNLDLPPVRVEQEIFVDTRDEFCPLEDRQAVCDQLCKALQLTNGFSHIASIIYDEKAGRCRIHFAHGFRDVNVAMDRGGSHDQRHHESFKSLKERVAAAGDFFFSINNNSKLLLERNIDAQIVQRRKKNEFRKTRSRRA